MARFYFSRSSCRNEPRQREIIIKRCTAGYCLFAVRNEGDTDWDYIDRAAVFPTMKYICGLLPDHKFSKPKRLEPDEAFIIGL